MNINQKIMKEKEAKVRAEGFKQGYAEGYKQGFITGFLEVHPEYLPLLSKIIKFVMANSNTNLEECLDALYVIGNIREQLRAICI